MSTNGKSGVRLRSDGIRLPHQVCVASGDGCVIPICGSVAYLLPLSPQRKDGTLEGFIYMPLSEVVRAEMLLNFIEENYGENGSSGMADVILFRTIADLVQLTILLNTLASNSENGRF